MSFFGLNCSNFVMLTSQLFRTRIYSQSIVCIDISGSRTASHVPVPTRAMDGESFSPRIPRIYRSHFPPCMVERQVSGLLTFTPLSPDLCLDRNPINGRYLHNDTMLGLHCTWQRFLVNPPLPPQQPSPLCLCSRPRRGVLTAQRLSILHYTCTQTLRRFRKCVRAHLRLRGLQNSSLKLPVAALVASKSLTTRVKGPRQLYFPLYPRHRGIPVNPRKVHHLGLQRFQGNAWMWTMHFSMHHSEGTIRRFDGRFSTSFLPQSGTSNMT